jgi:L-lactate utilization protein LutC
MERLIRVAEQFEKRGIHTRVFENALEVTPALLLEIPQDVMVAFGGSVTLQGLGIYEALQNRGQTVLWHWKADKDKISQVRRDAMKADVYLSSSNAVIEDGRLVNVDGAGNRIAAMIFGPPRVIVIVGRNKLVPTYDDALERIKTIACPKNAERLNRNLPCRYTGRCNDCSSPERMCKFTLTTENNPESSLLEVWLVNEDMGY